MGKMANIYITCLSRTQLVFFLDGIAIISKEIYVNYTYWILEFINFLIFLWNILLYTKITTTFVSDWRQVGGFLQVPVSPTNKTDRHDITEILLKVALNTTNQPTATCYSFLCLVCETYLELMKYKVLRKVKLYPLH